MYIISPKNAMCIRSRMVAALVQLSQLLLQHGRHYCQSQNQYSTKIHFANTFLLLMHIRHES